MNSVKTISGLKLRAAAMVSSAVSHSATISISGICERSRLISARTRGELSASTIWIRLAEERMTHIVGTSNHFCLDGQRLGIGSDRAAAPSSVPVLQLEKGGHLVKETLGVLFLFALGGVLLRAGGKQPLIIHAALGQHLAEGLGQV